MLIFFSILLITLSILSLYKGTLFLGSVETISKLADDFANKESPTAMDLERFQYNVRDSSMLLLLGVYGLAAFELIFYSTVIRYDELTIPTVAMMALLVYNFLKNFFKKKKPATTIKDKIANAQEVARGMAKAKDKIRSFPNTINKVTSLVYYIYAFLILISYYG